MREIILAYFFFLLSFSFKICAKRTYICVSSHSVLSFKVRMLSYHFGKRRLHPCPLPIAIRLQVHPKPGAGCDTNSLQNMKNFEGGNLWRH